MTGAMVLIILNDSMIKLATDTVPAAQAIAVRGGFATALVLAAVLAVLPRGQLAKLAERRTMGRAVLDVVGTFTYLYALFNLPIADATAINMAAPLFVVPLAVVYLRETVPWPRWASVLAGFAGMLLVVRPGGASYTPWAALCLGATVLHAFRDIYTRGIALHVPSLIVTLATALAVTLCALVITTAQGWQPMATNEVGLLAGAAVCLAGGYHLGVVAMRAGDVSLIGAFRYSALPAAAVLGWLIWGQLPDLLALAGMAVLVVAGVAILHGAGSAEIVPVSSGNAHGITEK